MKEHRVLRAYAFGSSVTESFTADSDIDLLVEFDEHLNPLDYADLWWDLVERLESIVSRPVDLVSAASIHNPYFREELERTRERIL